MADICYLFYWYPQCDRLRKGGREAGRQGGRGREREKGEKEEARGEGKEITWCNESQNQGVSPIYP